jgi:phage terminase small subunit
MRLIGAIARLEQDMPRKSSPKLTVICASSATTNPPQPPDYLDDTGKRLWFNVVREYEFSDPASLETPAQACAAADRAFHCAAQIAEDGMLIATKVGGARDHPLIKHELTARSLVCRLLARLGLDLEPVRGTLGRPPGPRQPREH